MLIELSTAKKKKKKKKKKKNTVGWQIFDVMDSLGDFSGEL